MGASHCRIIQTYGGFGFVKLSVPPWLNRPPSSSAASRRSLVSSTWRGESKLTASPNFLYGWLGMLVYIYMIMYVRMYVCIYGWMDGWMDRWMDGCMDACVHACMYYMYYLQYINQNIVYNYIHIYICDVYICISQLEQDNRLVTSLLYIQGLNQRIDVYGYRLDIYCRLSRTEQKEHLEQPTSDTYGKFKSPDCSHIFFTTVFLLDLTV